MIALLLLAAIGTAIVVSCLVINGNREPREFAAGSAPAPAAAPARRRRARASQPAPEPPAAGWPGGPCPSCGNETYPGAKFCGECGQRLSG